MLMSALFYKNWCLLLQFRTPQLYTVANGGNNEYSVSVGFIFSLCIQAVVLIQLVIQTLKKYNLSAFKSLLLNNISCW